MTLRDATANVDILASLKAAFGRCDKYEPRLDLRSSPLGICPSEKQDPAKASQVGHSTIKSFPQLGA